MNYQALAQLSEQEKIDRIMTLQARIDALEAQASAQEDLQQRETQFRTLAENSPDLIARVDREYTYLYVNKAFADTLNMAPTQIIGTKTNAIPAHPETISRWQKIREQVFDTGKTLKYELEHKESERQEGQIYYESYVVPEFNEEGIVQSILSITRNITSLKLAQQGLEANQSNLRALIENIQDNVWSVDHNYNLLVINDNMIRNYQAMFGIKMEPGMNIFDSVDDQYRAEWQDFYDKALNGERFQLEYAYDDLVYEISFSPIFNRDSHSEGVIVFSRDITEKKLSERQLNFQAEVLQSIKDAVIAIDNDYHATYLNRAASELYGIDMEDSLGKSLTDLYVSEWYDPKDAINAMRELEIQEHTFTELRHKKQDGSYIDVEATTNVLRDANGEQTGLLAVIRDVSERRKLEQLYRALVNQSILCFSVVAKDGTLIYVNRGMALMSGYSAEELMAMNEEEVLILYSPQQHDLIKKNRHNRLAGLSAPNNYEIEMIRKDGKRIWLELNTTVGEYDGEKVVFSAALDVTARRLAQRQLKEQEALYRLIAENTTDIITLTDIEGLIDYVSPSVTPQLGYTPEERIGQSTWTIIHPDDLSEVLSARKSYLKKNYGLFQYRIQHKDGHYLWMETSVRAVRKEDGSIESVIGITRNIEERKQAEIRQQESQHFIQSITDAAPYIIYVSDYEKEYDVFINNFGARFFGIPQDEPFRLTANFIAEHYHPEDLEFARAQIKVLDGSKPNQVAIFDARVKNASGEWRWLSFRTVPFKFSEDGKLQQTLGLCVDITEQRTAEERAFKLALEQEKVQFLTDFIVSASHEFRTPLSVINTSLYMIVRQNDLPEDYPYVIRIHERVDDILKLVESITTFARLERDIPHFVPVYFEHVLKDTITQMSDRAMQRDIRLNLEVHAPDLLVEANIRNIMLAMEKIVENAILFNVDGGDVFIGLALTEDHKQAVITVRDTGIGIPLELQERVFDSFFRIDPAQTKRGFGLGLAIARIIIDQHHGEINVESTSENGTTITIYLPVVQDKS